MDYKNDDSFFLTVFAPFTFYGTAVKFWLLNSENGKYRFIRDWEIENEFWNAQQVSEMYPGTKLIGIAVNPWARIHYAYTQLCLMKEQLSSPIDLSLLPLDTFDDFVKNISNIPPQENFWFSFKTPMFRWFEYEENGETKTVEFLFKDETLEQDFKRIQDYFHSDVPLNLEQKLSNYQQYYTDETRKIIEDIFKEDIDKFGYTF